MKIAFSRQVFEKYSNTNFQENPSSGNRVLPCGRTDRRTGRHHQANRCFSKICKRAQKFYVLSTHCFVWISEQTAIISLYNINRLVFITETACVYCAVRTGTYINSV